MTNIRYGATTVAEERVERAAREALLPCLVRECLPAGTLPLLRAEKEIIQRRKPGVPSTCIRDVFMRCPSEKQTISIILSIHRRWDSHACLIYFCQNLFFANLIPLEIALFVCSMGPGWNIRRKIHLVHSQDCERLVCILCTGVHFMVRSGFREYEGEKLRSPACCRQENTTYSSHKTLVRLLGHPCT